METHQEKALVSSVIFRYHQLNQTDIVKLARDLSSNSEKIREILEKYENPEKFEIIESKMNKYENIRTQAS